MKKIARERATFQKVQIKIQFKRETVTPRGSRGQEVALHALRPLEPLNELGIRKPTATKIPHFSLQNFFEKTLDNRGEMCYTNRVVF